MLRYSTDLRAMTSGKATFEMEFSHYDPISGRKLIRLLKRERNFLRKKLINKIFFEYYSFL